MDDVLVSPRDDRAVDYAPALVDNRDRIRQTQGSQMTEPQPCDKFRDDMVVTPEFIQHLETCERCVAVLNYLAGLQGRVLAQFPPKEDTEGRTS